MKERGEKASEGGGRRRDSPCEWIIKSTPSVNIAYSCLITSSGEKCCFVCFLIQITYTNAMKDSPSSICPAQVLQH